MNTRTRKKSPRKSSKQSSGRPAGRLIRATAEHHLGSLTSSLSRLVKRPLGSAMTAAVLAVALGLPAALYWLVVNLQTVERAFPDAREISLFLPMSADQSQADQLAGNLNQRADVAATQVLNPDQELAVFRQAYSAAEVLDALPENPLPWVVLVTPDPSLSNASQVMDLAADLETLPTVDSALVDLKWLSRLNSLLALASRGAVVLAVLLALAALLIVGNTIGLELKTRREEIEITRLLGASNGFVRRPFLYLGLCYGLLGGLLAAGVIVLGVALLSEPAQRVAASYGSSLGLVWPGPVFLLILVAGGGLVGWLGAWLAASRQIIAVDPD